MRIAADPSTDPADYAFRHRARVRFAETDAMGIVHHSRYLPIMEEARVAYLRQIGHPYQSIRDEGLDLTVLEVFVQYRLPLRFDDEVDVHLSVVRVDRATFQMAYLLSVDGELRATGITVHGAVTSEGRPTRLPAWLRELRRSDSDPRAIRIGNDRLRVEVAPDNGGRIAQITADGVDLLIGHGEGPDPGSALSWGSYPMVPWAGRLRRGHFTFDGEQYGLPANFGGHAIHGVGFDATWAVTRQSAEHVELELVLPRDARWPFGGVARQLIRVDGTTLRCELAAFAGEHPMPVALGWHPWFRKPDSIDFRPRSMYRRDDDHIAVDELVPVPDGPWDDCFVNTEPVLMSIGGVGLRMRSDCTDWVVYDMPAHATCVEPQSAPPDAFNIGPHRLEPHEGLDVWFDLSITGRAD
jgi:aldose 1-epimerase